MTDPNNTHSQRTTGDQQRILVPIDGSDLSFKALEHACSVYSDTDITVVHALEAPTSGGYESITGGSSSDFEELQQQREWEVESLFNEARDLANEYGVEHSTASLKGNVTTAILTHAEEIDADQIIIGSRGRHAIKRALLGSISTSIVRQAPVPVTVVR